MAYQIDSEKLAEVTRMFNQEVDPRATEELVEIEVCSESWENVDPGGEYGHQHWLNTASVEEIVDWLASFYSAD